MSAIFFKILQNDLFIRLGFLVKYFVFTLKLCKSFEISLINVENSQQEPKNMHSVGAMGNKAQNVCIHWISKAIGYPNGVFQLNGSLWKKWERESERKRNEFSYFISHTII